MMQLWLSSKQQIVSLTFSSPSLRKLPQIRKLSIAQQMPHAISSFTKSRINWVGCCLRLPSLQAVTSTLVCLNVNKIWRNHTKIISCVVDNVEWNGGPSERPVADRNRRRKECVSYAFIKINCGIVSVLENLLIYQNMMSNWIKLVVNWITCRWGRKTLVSGLTLCLAVTSGKWVSTQLPCRWTVVVTKWHFAPLPPPPPTPTMAVTDKLVMCAYQSDFIGKRFRCDAIAHPLLCIRQNMNMHIQSFLELTWRQAEVHGKAVHSSDPRFCSILSIEID